MTEREARKLAKEVVSDEYAVIDEIWNRRRVNYHSVAADYDRDTIKDINRKLPNLLVKNGGVALDELADEYGFESTCDLIEMFLAYTPKRVRLEQLVAQFLEENPHCAVLCIGFPYGPNRLSTYFRCVERIWRQPLCKNIFTKKTVGCSVRIFPACGATAGCAYA